MEIFKLVGSILVDSAGAEKSISKTGEKAEGLGSKLAGGIKTAAKWGAGIVSAATAVGTAMVAAAKDTAEQMDAIDKASQRMGLAAESYQELAYAADLSGVNVSTLEKAAKKLEGTDLNLDDALTQIMSITDESERAAAAADLFGSNIAYEMTPLLAEGADGLANMRKEANDLGLVMSQDSVTAGAAMGDALSKLDQTMKAAKSTIAAELMPYAVEILNWVVDNLPIVISTLKKVMDQLMPIIQPILKGIMAAMKAFFALVNGDFDGFWNGIKEALENMADAALKLGEKIMDYLFKGIKGAWEAISGWVSEKIEWLKDKVSFWKEAKTGMSDKIDGSHASGLPFVPYDGYRATLHRGESVLSADSTREMFGNMLSQAVNAISAAGGGTYRVEVPVYINGKEFYRASIDDLRTVSKEIPEVLDD